MPEPACSVVVRCHNEEEHIGRLLAQRGTVSGDLERKFYYPNGLSRRPAQGEMPIRRRLIDYATLPRGLGSGGDR